MLTAAECWPLNDEPYDKETADPPVDQDQTTLVSDDCRVENGNAQPRGRVHVHVEYEPKGIEPGPNDVVYLESFARYRIIGSFEPVVCR